MIQAQIRLLKDGDSPLPFDERERIIEAKQLEVDEAFRRFLAWLAGDAPSNPAAARAAACSEDQCPFGTITAQPRILWLQLVENVDVLAQGMAVDDASILPSSASARSSISSSLLPPRRWY